MDKFRIFVAEHCGPCHVVREMAEKGQVDPKDVEIIDVESDEGFPFIAEYDLQGVPSAYMGKQKCSIQIDKDQNLVRIVCPGSKSGPPSSGEGLESQPLNSEDNGAS